MINCYCYLFLYLIIEYFTQFTLLLYELTPSSENSVRFANDPTSLLWYSSAILYLPLRRTNIIQTTTSTEIDPIRSAFSDMCHITNPIEETTDHQIILILYQPNQSTDLQKYYTRH